MKVFGVFQYGCASDRRKRRPAATSLNLVALIIVFYCLAASTPFAIAQTTYFEDSYIDLGGVATSWYASYDSRFVDWNLDGRLDLLFGYGWIPNTGKGDVFGAYVDWPVDTGGQISVGDMNGDNRPDILLRQELYFSVDGQVHAPADWLNPSGKWILDHNLADMDGDGLLDIVCCYMVSDNDVGTNEIYVNEVGGTLRIDEWIPAVENPTQQCAVGDVDGDGDLDAVFVNQRDFADLLYLNQSGEGPEAILPRDPNEQLDTNYTWRVALGDLDGDGDLDLVRTQPQGLMVNLNHHGQSDTLFARSPDQVIAGSFHGVTLGDVDRDGDLDILGGTESAQSGSGLYLNAGNGTFAQAPAWEVPGELFVPGGLLAGGIDDLTLGDVDGDGDLDLYTHQDPTPGTGLIFRNRAPPLSPACTDSAQSIAAVHDLVVIDQLGTHHPEILIANGHGVGFCMNIDGELQSPLPFSISEQDSRALAVGDVNGDGHTDLVLGNYLQHNVVYTGSPGGTSFQFGWESNAALKTTSVVLHDVDADGDLDLVFGNENGSNELYLNHGEPDLFSHTPDWSIPAGPTNDLAVGDLTGDGIADLVCANSGGTRTAVYVGNGTTFAEEPAWEPYENWATRSVAVGDINGDGWLDLACGNPGRENTVFRGTSTGLSRDPFFLSAEMDSTGTVAIADADGNGDLDLVCGNLEGGTVIYFNRGGFLERNASWSSRSASPVTTLGLADLDRDGDLDLVTGHRDQVIRVHTGMRHPVHLFDPMAPSHHLADNAPWIDNVTVMLTAENNYRIDFTAFDVESDPVWILPQYRYETTGVWHTVGAAALHGPFDCSPEGEQDSIDWDVQTLPFDGRPVIVRLQAIPIPRRLDHEDGYRLIPSYQLAMDPLVVRRPQASAPAVLQFAGVTVGDSTVSTLQVANSGNQELVINGATPPSTEMRLVDAPPIRVPPGESYDVSVILVPRLETEIQGDLVLHCTDPLTPDIRIAVETEICPLEAGVQPLTTGDTARLGVDLTVLVNPLECADLELCTLHYRPVTFTGSYTALPMTSEGASFAAVIPREDVSEYGLEYYVELQNGTVITYEPVAGSAAPDTLAVESAAGLTSEPFENAGTDFLAGRAVRIEAIPPTGTNFFSGAIHVRRGGDTEYSTLDLALNEGVVSVSVPDTLIGPRGVEYWAEVTTGTAILTDPAVSPASNPHTIAVTVQDLVETVSHPGLQYRMVSVPLRFGPDFAGTLEDLLAEQEAFGPYDVVAWRSYRWLPGAGAAGRYVELSEADHAAEFRPEPGRAWWLICRQNAVITTAPVSGYSTPSDSACTVILNPGWNQVGNPFAFTVAWDEALVEGQPLAAAVDAGIVGGSPQTLDGGAYTTASLLEPFGGYWIENLSDGEVVLAIPPREAPPASPAAGDANKSSPTWTLTVQASSCGTTGSACTLGVAADAVAGRDRHDRRSPPPQPGRAVTVSVPLADGDEPRGHHRTDIREEDRGQAWLLDVAKNFAEAGPGDGVTLSVGGLASLPNDLSVVLLDLALGREVDLRTDSGYSFLMGRRPAAAGTDAARFTLLVGDAAFVAEQAAAVNDLPRGPALHPNRPNPFNPATVIRYEVPAAGRVRLQIYDIRGRLVATLVDEASGPGRFEVAWRGKDTGGRTVAAGVYFCRLQTGGGATLIRKMALVK